MNFSRALTRFLSPSSRSQKWPLPRPAAMGTSASPAKRAPKRVTKTQELKPEMEKPGPPQVSPVPLPLKDPCKFPRPSEIPFQPRVANSIHLVGSVGVPVQLETSPDGACSAVSVLVHEKTVDFPRFCIPVIFQGDLAQIAACHLKEDDLVYITGQLSGDVPPLTVEGAHTRIQVLAHSLSFVDNSFKKDSGMMSEQTKKASNSSASIEENSPTVNLWKDLLSNPHKWWDNRTSQRNPSGAAFRHKDNGQLLWINESTPEWVLSKLETYFGESTKKKSLGSGNVKEKSNSSESLWTDLVANPQQWSDNREKKLNGSVKQTYPDFKHKVTQEALWLNCAPDWVSSKLGTSGGSGDLKSQEKDQSVSSAQENGKEELWKDLTENPSKWWDNRLAKRNPKAPDFKHKDSGEGLWLDSSPSWVLPRLPTEKKGDDRWTKAATLLS